MHIKSLWRWVMMVCSGDPKRKTTRPWTGCAIPPDGGKGMYNFTVDQPPGTHWWHSHVGTQFADGLYGAIIIEPANGALTPVQEDVPYTDDQARVRLRAVAP